MATGRKLHAGEFNAANNYEIPLVEKKSKLVTLFNKTLLPPERPDLDEWSDENVYIPKGTSSEPGQWETSRFPFLRRIMKCLSPSSIAKEIVAIKGAQLGFTSICINWMEYIPAVCPGPTMYVQKTKDSAEDFSSQKLEPHIAECRAIDNLLGKKKPKELSNEALNKGFPGGFIVLGGANSSSFLRSKSIEFAMADEEDSFKGDIEGDGAPIGMIRKRQSNYPFSKFFRLSTPKYKETSTIETGYNQGSKEQYYVPCPHCNPGGEDEGFMFVMLWKQIEYSEELDEYNLPKYIHLICPNCGAAIEEHHKDFMLEKGDWFSEKNSPGKRYRVGDVEKPSFQISSLYSPLGFFSWRDAVAEWFEYQEKKDKNLLQVFINQTLGESYSAASQDISSAWLYERREKYTAKIPMGALVLTAGVDVQMDRLEVEIVGWGLHSESWSIDYAVIWGSPDFLVDSEGEKSVWGLLDEYLEARYTNEQGQEYYVECTAVDAQYKTETVNTFCLAREHRRVFPTHGQEGWGKGYLKRPKKRHEEYKAWNYTLFVDELKEKTYNLLKVKDKGPGFCHFPDYEHYSKTHFQQLTAESKNIITKGRQPKIVWELPSGARNEQLDCRNYATAALLIYSPNLEFRAEQQNELNSLGVDGAVGVEGSTSHLQNVANMKDNNRRALYTKQKKPKKKRNYKKNSGGVW